jgi:SAM-dependent methyltransferase
MNFFRALQRWWLNAIDSPPALPHKPPVPPRELIDGVGGGDFDKVGREFFGYFTRIGGLKPRHNVLDAGCGCGRMAVPLIPYLNRGASYHGFDIVPAAVQWSRENIAAHDPRFQFELADVFNKTYHPAGKYQPAQYPFPYQDGFFDFAFLTSVFTHMLPADMQHYLSEIVRTLKKGGRCLVTAFLLNGESRALIAAGKSSITFEHPFPDCAVFNADLPEAAVAYEERFFLECLARHGMRPMGRIHYGSWPGRAHFLSYQDILVAAKL